MGDIYLLKNEPWEATLLYSQVEKSNKEQPIGYEAKLRNAKLSYYKGDFELAQGHLDILKMATSREIANDAMDLSLLIQDNTAMDTLGEAMKEYAFIELLLFQNKNEQALQGLNSLLEKYPKHSLTDEVYWLQAQIFMKENQNEKAIQQLEKIVVNYPLDILGDDAHFLMAKLYEEKLGEKEKAMEMYQNHLTKYPGSIYVAESRKRFRQLRGDSIN
jgi:TolA-binding protein